MKMKRFLLNFESNSIKLLSIAIITILSFPIAYTFINAISKNSSFANLIIDEGILMSYLITTVELVIKVGIFSSIIGFCGAYFNVMYEYKFKKLLNVLFILPLSIPIYVGAYTYTEIYYDFPILETLFKNPFTLNGSVFIYVIFLYPYVYLGAKSYLKNNMAEYLESGRVLGLSGFSLVRKIVLPLARPVIIASSLLVIFETLSDFAVLKYYGVETISKLINDSWFLLGEKATAAKLAVLLLVVVFALVFGEKLLRGKKRNNSNYSQKLKAITPKLGFLISGYTFLIGVITLGFVLPVYNIMMGVIKNFSYFFKPGLFQAVQNTLLIVGLVIIIVIAVALILASSLRLFNKKAANIIYSIGTIGYSIPSIVLSLGVYVILLKLDLVLYPILSNIGVEKLILTGTIFALVFALSIKYLSIAFSQFYAQHQKIDKSIFEASTMLGNGFVKTFLKVDLPMLKSSLKVVSILLFIDVIKELTITYSLRPFNFNTLSTEVYRYAGNEMLGVSAIPSSIIIVLSTILIIFLERRSKNAKTN